MHFDTGANRVFLPQKFYSNIIKKYFNSCNIANSMIFVTCPQSVLSTLPVLLFYFEGMELQITANDYMEKTDEEYSLLLRPHSFSSF